MKRLILLLIGVLLLHGCSLVNNQVTEIELTNTAAITAEVTPTTEPIPAFETNPKETLTLPAPFEYTDTADFMNSLVSNYEIVHFTEFENEFAFDKMEADKSDIGYIIRSTKSDNTTMTSNAVFVKSLDEYFNTPDNSYGVLIRFRTDEVQKLNFSFDSKFGRIMLDFTDGLYPSFDTAGDWYGDPMYKYDWNNYYYSANDWAYAFLTINKYGQKNCYIWSESNVNNYSYVVSYAEDGGGENPYKFSFEITEKGKTVTISDIWIYSYEELMR